MEQEHLFKVRARRNGLFGKWAADQLGLLVMKRMSTRGLSCLSSWRRLAMMVFYQRSRRIST